MAQLTRSQIIDLSNSAYHLKNYQESRKILIAWMKKYPNDLWICYRLAIILYKLGEFENAIRLGELITTEDPEFGQAWGLLAILYPEMSPERQLAEYRALKLTKSVGKSKPSFWPFKREKDETDQIELDEFDELNSIENAKMLMNDEDHLSAFRIVNLYYRRWPRALQFRLIVGHILCQMNRAEEGMELIQSAVDSDITGQVAERIWKEENPYRNLWPKVDVLSIPAEGLGLSYEVVRLAGLLNVLTPAEEPAETVPESSAASENVSEVQDPDDDGPVGVYAASVDPVPESDPDETDAQPDDETKEMIESSDKSLSVFEKLRLSRTSRSVPQIGKYVYKVRDSEADDRKPVYVVMSSISGLTRKYGTNNKKFIDQEMRSVAETISNRKGWEGRVFYPDEFITVGSDGISADVVHNFLVRLDESLAEENKMIGALLIVGDDDVIPFFYIKNPIDDGDIKVPSDTPYGSTDDQNYWDMQWLVGRVPGDNSADPGFLLDQLRSIQKHHIMRYSRQKQNEKQVSRKDFRKSSRRSLGYTCAAWLTPSSIVYKQISDTSSLLVCPQTTSANFPVKNMDSCDYAYFNLHGMKGLPNWYGQKKSNDTSSGPLTPVALEIGNLKEISKTPKVVFSESCYGAETIHRNEKNCISLHMLGKTTSVFVGSTTIAYGALGEKLVAADLLGYLFWSHLGTGVSCGEAFRRAKKNLAMEVEQKHSALNSEIQKTLLSFVYYGDPLYSVDESADINDLSQRSKVPHVYKKLTEDELVGKGIGNDMAYSVYRKIVDEFHLDYSEHTYSRFQVKKVLVPKGSPNHKMDKDYFVLVYVKDYQIGNVTSRAVIRAVVNSDGDIVYVSSSR